MNTHDVLVERRTHDLPPLWDDQPVTWRDWETNVSSLHYHLPLAALACAKCGSLNPQAHASGRVTLPPDPAVIDLIAVKHLFASRCPDCANDTVYDLDTDELWDLEPSDYLDAGSLDPSTLQGGLF